MSTIVAVKKENKICIAADSLTTFGETKLTAQYDQSYEKIIHFAESYIGIVGSASHQMVLENALTTIRKDVVLSDRQSVFKTFNRLHPILKDKYYLNPKEEEGDPYESSRIDALIVNNSGIFGIYSLREVFEYSRFWAIGSGSDYALGAMHALYDGESSAEDITRAGVEAGAAFNSATALPMTLHSIDLDNSPESFMV